MGRQFSFLEPALVPGYLHFSCHFQLSNFQMPFGCNAERHYESAPDNPAMQMHAGSLNHDNVFLPSMDHIKQENCLMIWKQL